MKTLLRTLVRYYCDSFDFFSFTRVWYSFATQSAGKNINGAKTRDFVNWQRLGNDALPDSEMKKATWAGQTGDDNKWLIWAPDVWQRNDGKYVMYYSALDAQSIKQHCIGAATSPSPSSPFTPEASSIVCEREQGGAIDASHFSDQGKNYMAYKIDANSIQKAPSLWLQEMSCSGDKEGLIPEEGTAPIKLLDSDPSRDGPQGIEAPYLIKRGNVYYLFFSTHFYADATYNTEYATATSLQGPWTRADQPFLKSVNETSADCPSLNGPGGASFAGDKVVFHSRHLGADGKPATDPGEPRGMLSAGFWANGGQAGLL
ncbi:MAG: hypothetical protein Q9160_004189 [Pyrenula sp. 1 TL-2023]